MKKLLIVIDMQNDFIDGPLGTPEAQAIVPKVVEKINNWNGDLAFTQDTHNKDIYFKTDEGQHLPILHCVEYGEGWCVNDEVISSITEKFRNIATKIQKCTFANHKLTRYAAEFPHVEIIGLCTNICVLINALLIKASSPETQVIVDSSCCAGTTPELHEAALAVMRSCHIEVR